MQRTIVNTLLVVCLVGLTSAGYLLFRPTRIPPISVRDQDTDSLVDIRALNTMRDYDLFIADNEVIGPDDSLTWQIRQLDPTGPIERDFELNERVREWRFRDTGYYEVRAFHRLKEVGSSIMHVIDGDRFEIDRGTDDHLIVGNGSRFVDRSTNVARRLWSVTDPATGAKLDSSDAVAFEWTPIDTGSYLVHVFVESGSGKEHEEEWMVIVDPLPPPEPIVEAKPTPAPKPSEPKPWKPKEVTPAAAPVSNGCFVNHKLDGSNFMVEVKVPKREQISRWSDEATVFTFSPKNDCMFTGFDYFSKAGIDNIRISIACETPGICAGKPAAEIKVKGGYDAHSFARIDFQRLPIMNKDFKYRITIKAEAPGQLGFFPIESDRFSSTRSGSSYNGMDGTLRFKNESMETCVFNLRFTR